MNSFFISVIIMAISVAALFLVFILVLLKRSNNKK
ncbi:hypothetical protein SAMN05216353_14223 [Halobacillus alkaliphilus]|uniref:Uncharacterized protein n=1 Tax=Halobacillus alkaliphilus TaxID=396056 RepID=A0A1I2RYN0_9BACI|nr:hypothetical protein SAMN05216353_14223 [Halobacillus alkaliphilus]